MAEECWICVTRADSIYEEQMEAYTNRYRYRLRNLRDDALDRMATGMVRDWIEGRAPDVQAS